MHPPSEQETNLKGGRVAVLKKKSLKDTEIVTANNRKVGNWVRPNGSFVI